MRFEAQFHNVFSFSQILYQSVMNGIRLGAYEYINTKVRKFDAHDSFFFLKNMGVAGTVGGLGAWVGKLTVTTESFLWKLL